MTYVIEPDGWSCTLANCRPGHFMYFGHLCFKSEYLTDDGKIEAYNDGGEFFWAGMETEKQRRALVVQPVVMREVPDEGDAAEPINGGGEMSILDDLTNDAERHIESLTDRAIGTVMDRIDAIVSGHRFQFQGTVRTSPRTGGDSVIMFDVTVEATKR